MKGQQRGRADFDIDAFVAENFQTDFPWDKEIGSHQELDAFILKLRKQGGLHAWHDKVDRIKRVFEPRADTPPKPTHVYLVTLEEDGQSFWKFGITTKTSAKKRNSHYTDTHRWVEVPTNAMAVEMETHIGSIIQQVALEHWGKGAGHESVPCDFPFDVMLEIFDFVTNLWVHRELDGYVGDKDEWLAALTFMAAGAYSRALVIRDIKWRLTNPEIMDTYIPEYGEKLGEPHEQRFTNWRRRVIDEARAVHQRRQPTTPMWE